MTSCPVLPQVWWVVLLAVSHQPSGKAYCWLGEKKHWDSGSSVTFFELLIFRINNLGENYRQIFGTKGLIGNIFRNNILAGGFGGVSPFEV
jgi:hypothetical protein